MFVSLTPSRFSRKLTATAAAADDNLVRAQREHVATLERSNAALEQQLAELQQARAVSRAQSRVCACALLLFLFFDVNVRFFARRSVLHRSPAFL